jgi:hypothetical protein
MLATDSRWQYAILDPREFALQTELQVLSIIYHAAEANYILGQRIKYNGQNAENIAARLLSGIHTSALDTDPHLTILLPAMLSTDPDKIYHIVASFNRHKIRWTYASVKDARDTTRARRLASPKYFRWDQLVRYKDLT